MVDVKTESQHKGEFLVTRNPGSLSFEKGVLKMGNVVTDGRLLAIDGDGKFIPATGDVNTGGDSDETFAGFAYGAVDATAADTPIVVVARLAEVNAAEVTLHAVAGGGAAAATAAVKAAIAKDNFLILR